MSLVVLQGAERRLVVRAGALVVELRGEEVQTLQPGEIDALHVYGRTFPGLRAGGASFFVPHHDDTSGRWPAEHVEGVAEQRDDPLSCGTQPRA